MIQINLLPDVKMQYVKAKKLRRTIFIVCLIISSLSIAFLLILSVSVFGVQKQHMANLDQDISDKTKELQAIPNVSRILTVQNQMNSLPSLQSTKPEASRVFAYVKQIAPTEANIDTLIVDFTAKTMEISGGANDLAAVNKFTDTLKFTTYVPSDATADVKGQNAFTAVTLDKFGVTAATAKTGKPASYTIKLNFAEDIMSSTKAVKLVIPSVVTTRSEVDALSSLFQPQAPTEQGGTR